MERGGGSAATVPRARSLLSRARCAIQAEMSRHRDWLAPEHKGIEIAAAAFSAVASGPVGAGARPGGAAVEAGAARGAAASEAGAAAEGLGLGAAYPNPFDRSTVVPFHLERAADVRVVVYDVLGRVVVALTEGRHEAGAHRVHFDGSALPAGVYVVRLEGAGSTQAVRVTLAR